MTKYRVYPMMYATCKSIEVEAESPEEALELAQEEFEPPLLCWSCANEVDIEGEAIFELKDVEEIQ